MTRDSPSSVTSGAPQLDVIDLDTGETPITRPITASSSTWAFSPCGDAIGLLTTSGATNFTAIVLGTTTGTQLGTSYTGTGAAVSFAVKQISGNDQHVVTVDGTDHILAADTAANDCQGGGGGGGSDTPPTGVTGTAAVGAAQVQWTAPSSGTVTGYVITPSDGGTPITSLTAGAGQTTEYLPLLAAGDYTFTVEAEFADGTSQTSDPSNSITVVSGSACSVTDWTTGPSSGSGTSPTTGGAVEASFSYSVSGPTVALTDTSTGSGGPYSIQWSFGDGRTSSDTVATLDDARAPSYAYWGNYLVSLTVTDSQSRTSTAYAIVHLVPSSPGNDDFANATALSGDSGTLSGSTTQATCESGEPGDSNRQATVWYRYQPTNDGTLVIDGRQSGISVSVFTGDSLGNLVKVPDDSTAQFGNLRRVAVTAGTTYWIQLSSGLPGADFSVPWERGTPPPNDNIDQATGISPTTDSSVAGDLTFASVGSDDPPDGCDPRFCRLVATVWYTWTAQRDGWVTFEDASGHQADFFEGTPGSLTYDGGGSMDGLPMDNSLGSNASAALDQQAGHTYYLRVSAVQGGDGFGDWSDPTAGLAPFTLDWYPAPANDGYVAPQPITGGTGSVDGTTNWAYLDSPDSTDFSDVTSNVWYSWTAPSDDTYAFTASSDSMPRPAVTIFGPDGQGGYARVEPTTMPDATTDVDSTTGLPAEKGTTYLISVGAVNNLPYTALIQGGFKLNWALDPPIVTGVSPAHGGDGGGQTTTIAGSGLTGASAVTFTYQDSTGNQVSLTSPDFSVDNDNQITATTPPSGGYDGLVDIQVVSASSQTSPASPQDQYNFVPDPAVAIVSPRQGASDGGQTITVKGSGFSGGGLPQVVFVTSDSNDYYGDNVNVVNDHELTVDTPKIFSPDGPADVVVRTDNGSSGITPADEFTFGTSVTPPDAPTGLAASTPTDSEVDLSWAAVDGATSYEVLRGHSADGPWTVLASSSTPSYADSAVTANTTYYYLVEARSSGGTSDPSPAESATPGGGTVTVPPDAPSGLSAAAGDGSVDLSWSAPAHDGGAPVSGYDVFVGTTAGGEAASAVNAGPVSGTSYHVGGLTDGTAYYFTVVALNGAGSSSPSNEAHATPLAVESAPSAPGNVPAVGSSGAIGTGPPASASGPVTPQVTRVVEHLTLKCKAAKKHKVDCTVTSRPPRPGLKVTLWRVSHGHRTSLKSERATRKGWAVIGIGRMPRHSRVTFVATVTATVSSAAATSHQVTVKTR